MRTIVRQYKHLQIFVAFQALNIITAHQLLIACYEMPLDFKYHQTTNNFEKLLEHEDAENISKMATSIFLIIGLHIGPTRLLEVGPPNVKYDSKERFYEEYTSANWGDKSEIEEVMTANNNEDNDEEDS